MNEKVHNRVHIIMSVVIVILASIGAYGWVRSGDIADRVERLQTQLRAAQDSAQQIVSQLGELSLDYIGVENELGDALATVEHQQESISTLELSITDAADASGAIGVSIIQIDDFIDRVEEFNRPGAPTLPD